MSCDRLLAAGAVTLLLAGCGAKGPPSPPLSREPHAVRDLNVRQAGGGIELRWSRPRARVDGEPIPEPLTYLVLARAVDRTPAPGAPPTSGTPPGASAADESFQKDAEVVAEIVETPEQAAASTPPKPAKGERKGSTGEAAAEGASSSVPKGAPPGGQAATTATAARPPAETQYRVLLGPDHFPGTRFTSVRLAFAVVAQDTRRRRSRARPILEIDPV